MIECTSSTSQFYALIAPDGSALFVDYGSASGSFFSSFNAGLDGSDRMRFVEHSLPELRARYGLRRIDVAMPSHMHDDHLNGFPYLQRQHGTRAYENMKDVLEHPEGYLLGCTNAEPIKVDRTGRRGGGGLGGLDLTVVHSPATPSTRWPPGAWAGGGSPSPGQLLQGGDAGRGHAHPAQRDLRQPRGGGQLPALRGQAAGLRAGDHRPRARPRLRGTARQTWLYRDRMQAQTAHWEAILPTDHDGAPSGADGGTPPREPLPGARAPVGLGYGLDPRWVSLYPYQMRVDSRGEVAPEVRLRNYGRAPCGPASPSASPAPGTAIRPA